MTPRRAMPLLAAVVATAAACAGCAAADGARHVGANAGVLAPELRVVKTVTDCDPGSNAYCGTDLVAEGPPVIRSSVALRTVQSRALTSAKWPRVSGQARHVFAAHSPDGKVYISWATARDELRAVRQGYIRRPQTIVDALRASLREHRATISIALTAGP